MRRTGKAIGTLAAATSLAMVGGGLAFADSIEANTNGDTVIGGNLDKRLVFGQVCATTGADGINGGNGLSVAFYIDRGSNTNPNQTFGNSSAVDFSRNATVSNSGLKVAFGKAASEPEVAARLTTTSTWTGSTTGRVGLLPATVRLESTLPGPVEDGTVVVQVDATGLNNASSPINITRDADYKVHGTTVVNESSAGGTVDCTKPTVAYTVPSSAGASIEQGSTADAGFTCTDEVSPNGAAATGVAATDCTGIVTSPGGATTTAAESGFALPTSTLGTHTLSVTAVDRAGNVGTSSRTYEVVEPLSDDPTVTFLQPIDGDVINVAKSGRVIPVKVTIAGIDGLVADDVKLVMVAKSCTTGQPVDAVEEYAAAGAANSGNSFRFEDGKWIYNLATGKANSCATGIVTVKGVAAGDFDIKVTK